MDRKAEVAVVFEGVEAEVEVGVKGEHGSQTQRSI
jgi:hypothetical protein